MHRYINLAIKNHYGILIFSQKFQLNWPFIANNFLNPPRKNLDVTGNQHDAKSTNCKTKTTFPLYYKLQITTLASSVVPTAFLLRHPPINFSIFINTTSVTDAHQINICICGCNFLRARDFPFGENERCYFLNNIV